MKAIILDKNLRELKTITGKIEKNQLNYKEGAILGFFGTKKYLPINYDHTIDRGKEKYAYYKFDGKSYIQIMMKEQTGDMQRYLEDYITGNEIAEQAEASMLKEPFNSAQIFQLVMWGLVIVAIIALYLALDNTYNKVQAVITPMITAIQDTNRIAVQNHNDTIAMIKVLNKVLNRTTP